VRFLVKLVREGLWELSDLAFQRRVWMGRGGVGEMSSFVEAVETLFDDSGLGDELERGRPVFGGEADGELRALSSLVDRIDEWRDPMEIIDDPLMAEVRERAAAILHLIPADGSATPNDP
jgi:hypothetical protein